MAYTNMYIPNFNGSDHLQREKIILLEIRLEKAIEQREHLNSMFENIFSAIKKYGHVDLTSEYGDKITLVARAKETE